LDLPLRLWRNGSSSYYKGKNENNARMIHVEQHHMHYQHMHGKNVSPKAINTSKKKGSNEQTCSHRIKVRSQVFTMSIKSKQTPNNAFNNEIIWEHYHCWYNQSTLDPGFSSCSRPGTRESTTKTKLHVLPPQLVNQ
jgi:hypothetical protein